MINFLKVFEIDPDLEIISNESEMMLKFDSAIDIFFREHILNSITNENSKAARFRSNSKDIFLDCEKCFKESSFNSSAKSIAEALKNNMHFSVKNTFIFIVLSYKFTEKTSKGLFTDGEEIVAIMKMETNDGIQIVENNFEIQPNMLPDLGNSLQKCAFVYKSRIEKFDENNMNDGFHLRILDKQDKTISNYFINLMNSVVVADDEVMSRLAQRFIRKNSMEFTDSQAMFEKVETQLNVIMSQRKRTSIKSIFVEISPFLSKTKMDSAGKDIDVLADDTFNLILRNNPSATSNFTSQPTNGEKYIYKSETRSIWISVEKGLVEDGTVEIDSKNKKYIKITIPKNMVN